MSQEQSKNKKTQDTAFDLSSLFLRKNRRRVLISSVILVLVIAFIVGIIVIVQPGKLLFGSTYRTIETSGDLSEKLTVEPVITDLEVPWSISFIDNDSFFFTERPGRLRLYRNGELLLEPVLVVETLANGEAGLLGMTLHPDFPSSRFLYLAYTYRHNGSIAVKIERYSVTDDLALTSPRTLLDQIPAGAFHAGCKLAFGPDKKLYITTGDAGDRHSAQSLASLAGKTLRINDDGSIPDDNPFVNTPGAQKEIWSYGHRNAQALDWDSHGIMYLAEHGPSGFDGGFGNDEINIITKGGNYGWPVQIGNEKGQWANNVEIMMPVKVYPEAIAPGGLTIPKNSIIPELKDKVLVSGLRGTTILALRIEKGIVLSQELVIDNSFGRIRELVTSPEGYVYFSTSNRDGRGNPKSSDDAIYRIILKEE